MSRQVGARASRIGLADGGCEAEERLTAGAATAGANTKPARSTTLAYVDVLTRLRVLDELEA